MVKEPSGDHVIPKILAMFVPFMLPEVCISLSIAGPVLKHVTAEIRQDAGVKRAVALWRQIC